MGRPRRYYTYPGKRLFWGIEPLLRLNKFLLRHVGELIFIRAENRGLSLEEVLAKIKTPQVPPPFRRVKLPPGITCLGTSVQRGQDCYELVYEIPHGHPLPYQKALVWALEDAGLVQNSAWAHPHFFSSFRLSGQPAASLFINQHGDEKRSFLVIQVCPDSPPLEDEELILPPRLTIPDGAFTLEEIRMDGALALWPPGFAAADLLNHW